MRDALTGISVSVQFKPEVKRLLTRHLTPLGP